MTHWFVVGVLALNALCGIGAIGQPPYTRGATILADLFVALNVAALWVVS